MPPGGSGAPPRRRRPPQADSRRARACPRQVGRVGGASSRWRSPRKYERRVRWHAASSRLRLPAGAAHVRSAVQPAARAAANAEGRRAPCSNSGLLRVVYSGSLIASPAARPAATVRPAHRGVRRRIMQRTASELVLVVDDAIDVTPAAAATTTFTWGTTAATWCDCFSRLLADGRGTPGLRMPHFDHFRPTPSPSPAPAQRPHLDRTPLSTPYRRARRTGAGYRIVNLSLGPALPVDDQIEPHVCDGQSTTSLDVSTVQLVDVLPSATTGSRPPRRPASTACRCPPTWSTRSQSARAITARLRLPGRARPTAPRAPAAPAPWSRSRCGVAFGGTHAELFRGMLAGERLGEGSGTSFVISTAAHGIAGLAARLGRTPTSLKKSNRARSAARSLCTSPAADVAACHRGRSGADEPERYDEH